MTTANRRWWSSQRHARTESRRSPPEERRLRNLLNASRARRSLRSGGRSLTKGELGRPLRCRRPRKAGWRTNAKINTWLLSLECCRCAGCARQRHVSQRNRREWRIHRRAERRAQWRVHHRALVVPISHGKWLSQTQTRMASQAQTTNTADNLCDGRISSISQPRQDV